MNENYWFDTREFYKGIIENKDFLSAVSGNYCCYGKCTTAHSCPLNVDKMHMTIYVPYVTERTKNKTYICSSWFRQPEELLNRVAYMTEKLRPYTKNINYRLEVTQHSNLKKFLCNLHPYFEFDFHFENIQRPQMFFILDMYRRTFNIWYDKIWTCIPRLEEEFENLDFVNLWIFSDLINTWQAGDASFQSIYSWAVNKLFSPEIFLNITTDLATNSIFSLRLHHQSRESYYGGKTFFEKRSNYAKSWKYTDSFSDLEFDDNLYKAIYNTILNFKTFNKKITGYELF